MRLLVVGTAIAVAGGGAAAVGQGASNQSTAVTKASAIVPAPVFQAEDIEQNPTTDWITNGGNAKNQRYSPLTQINTSNVKNLKGVWKTDLRGRATAAKYSAESQPIVYKGTIFVTTGDDDVFAISAKTGKILWEHRGNLNQKISTVCCGWLNRGVAIGGGMAYYNRLDGKTQALDMKTGKVMWTKQYAQWQKGQTMTQAPLYLNGRIYIGVVGAEYGTRGWLSALDAKTGRQIWRFYTVPGKNDPGGDTWPKSGTEFLRGGASVWSTPAFDEKLGLLYISTGNAGSDWFGGDRPGKNLFACSVVAIDIKTGKMKWYFQEVHHDIWDYDTPSPPVLFDTTTASGKTITGLGEPGKTGWLYLLDRRNGKPLYGIDEKPVLQNKEQKTWPTQPIPRTGEFIPHVPAGAKEIARIKKQRDKNAKKVPFKVAEKMFTPPDTKSMLVYGPGPQGGNNWMPSSYNQKTNMFYICSANQYVGVLSAHSTFKNGQAYTGIGAISGIGFNESTGTFTAIDGKSGKKVWQKTWPEPCYSGTITTAGNLVFVGRNAGQYQAYDARNGKLLWSYQTGAGANDTASVFEMDGKQYMVLYSGGNSLVASPHGDSLYLFGLDGKLGPASGTGPGAGTNHDEGGAGGGDGQTASPTAGNAAAGATVWSGNCTVCHGATGKGGNGGPDLTTIPDAKVNTQVINQVTNGGGGMPAFKGQLTQKQIRDVAAYVSKTVATGKAK